MRRFIGTAGMAVTLLVGGIGLVGAQEGTPPSGAVPGPEECQIEPRTLESFEQLSGTPAAGTEGESPDGAASPTPFTQPEGEEAPAETVAAVDQTYRELVACLNAGDYLRAMALYTDDFIVENFAERGPLGLAALEDLAATPTPREEAGRIALISLSSVRLLPDGRVGAIVETNDQSRGEVGTVRIYGELEQVGDRYLIDRETVVDAGTGAEPSGDGQAAGQEVTIVSLDIYFEPADVTIPAGADVTVVLPNDGAALHNFSVDELGISVDIAPGETQQVTINAPAGEYEYYCAVPGHKEAGMVGTLIVQ